MWAVQINMFFVEFLWIFILKKMQKQIISIRTYSNMQVYLWKSSFAIASKGIRKHPSPKSLLTELKAFVGLLCVVFSLIAAGVWIAGELKFKILITLQTCHYVCYRQVRFSYASDCKKIHYCCIIMHKQVLCSAA